MEILDGISLLESKAGGKISRGGKTQKHFLFPDSSAYSDWSFLDGSTSSFSEAPFLNPLMAFPKPCPISGSFPAPNMIRIMTRMTMSSGIPIPNIMFLRDLNKMKGKSLYFKNFYQAKPLRELLDRKDPQTGYIDPERST